MKTFTKISAAIACLATVVILNSCSKSDDTSAKITTPTAGLYERLGGTEKVVDPANPDSTIEKGRLSLRSVVDSAIYIIAADNALTPYFSTLLAELPGDKTGLFFLSKNFTDFLSLKCGAKNVIYVGHSMSDAHNPIVNRRMAKSADDVAFNAFVAAIGRSLVKNNIQANTSLYNDLVAFLNSQRSDIVQKPSLYEQLGGITRVPDTKHPGQTIEKGRLTIRNVVEDAIYIIAADNRISDFFSTLTAELAGNPQVTTGYEALSTNFTNFIAQATGSKSIKYTGKIMKDAHNPVTNPRMKKKANEADFNAFIEDIGMSLNNNGVATSDPLYTKLVELLQSTKPDVVQQ